MFDSVFSLIAFGDFTGGMYAHFGIDEDSLIVDAVLSVRALFVR